MKLCLQKVCVSVSIWCVNWLACEDVVTVVADYFACQKFRGLATKRDTQIFRGGKFLMITSAKKKKSARNNLLLTHAIVLMERSYCVCVATTSTTAKQLPGKSYCASVSPGTRRTVTVMPSASCGNVIRGFTSSANIAKISPPRN